VLQIRFGAALGGCRSVAKPGQGPIRTVDETTPARQWSGDMITARRQKQQRLDALRQVAFFAACTKNELARIDALGARIEVGAGRSLTREGTAGQECFITLNGVATVTRRGCEVGVIGPGSIAGEMALLDHTTRNATVVTNTRMQLLVLNQREFAQLLAIGPHIEDALVRIIDERRPVSMFFESSGLASRAARGLERPTRQ
jgi:hypothetical protein